MCTKLLLPGGYPIAFNPLNPELSPICHLLALLGTYHILHVSWIRVNWKRNTNRNFVLSINWALDIGELLGSRPGHLIPGEAGHYYPAGCLGRRASLDVLEDAEFSRPYRYSNPDIVQPTVLCRERMRCFLQVISISEG